MQNGMNETELDLDLIDRIRLNRTKVDRIGPRWTEMGRIDRIGLNRMKVYKIGLNGM